MDLWKAVIFTLFSCYVQADPCTTPSEKPGQCESIVNCGLLWDLAVKPQISKEEIYMLRKSACGFSETLPKVCCPDVWDVQECVLSAAPPDRRSKCCGVAKDHQDGKSAYPWMGIIEFQKEIVGDFHNAILISGRYAISVAQCFAPKFIAKYGRPTIVRFGHNCVEVAGESPTTRCDKGSFSIPVESVLVHRQYDENGHFNDIALLKLIYTAPYTDTIRPICLPSSDFTADGDKGTSLVASGWGINNEGTNNNPNLRFSKTHYLEAEVCAATLKNITTEKTVLKKTQLCAVMRKNKSRLGLGAPLMSDKPKDQLAELIGVASFSLNEGLPDVYTKVYEYRSWILENIQN